MDGQPPKCVVGLLYDKQNSNMQNTLLIGIHDEGIYTSRNWDALFSNEKFQQGE